MSDLTNRSAKRKKTGEEEEEGEIEEPTPYPFSELKDYENLEKFLDGAVQYYGEPRSLERAMERIMAMKYLTVAPLDMGTVWYIAPPGFTAVALGKNDQVEVIQCEALGAIGIEKFNVVKDLVQRGYIHRCKMGNGKFAYLSNTQSTKSHVMTFHQRESKASTTTELSFLGHMWNLITTAFERGGHAEIIQIATAAMKIIPLASKEDLLKLDELLENEDNYMAALVGFEDYLLEGSKKSSTLQHVQTLYGAMAVGSTLTQKLKLATEFGKKRDRNALTRYLSGLSLPGLMMDTHLGGRVRDEQGRGFETKSIDDLQPDDLVGMISNKVTGAQFNQILESPQSRFVVFPDTSVRLYNTQAGTKGALRVVGSGQTLADAGITLIQAENILDLYEVLLSFNQADKPSFTSASASSSSSKATPVIKLSQFDV